MHICTAIKENVQSSQSERCKYINKREYNDDDDGAHLTPFGIEFQTEEKANEN